MIPSSVSANMLESCHDANLKLPNASGGPRVQSYISKNAGCSPILSPLVSAMAVGNAACEPKRSSIGQTDVLTRKMECGQTKNAPSGRSSSLLDIISHADLSGATNLLTSAFQNLYTDLSHESQTAASTNDMEGNSVSSDVVSGVSSNSDADEEDVELMSFTGPSNTNAKKVLTNLQRCTEGRDNTNVASSPHVAGYFDSSRKKGRDNSSSSSSSSGICTSPIVPRSERLKQLTLADPSPATASTQLTCCDLCRSSANANGCPQPAAEHAIAVCFTCRRTLCPPCTMSHRHSSDCVPDRPDGSYCGSHNDRDRLLSAACVSRSTAQRFVDDVQAKAADVSKCIVSVDASEKAETAAWAKTCRQIASRAQLIRHVVDECESQLLGELEAVVKERQSMRDSQRTANQKLLATIDHIVEFVTRILDNQTASGTATSNLELLRDPLDKLASMLRNTMTDADLSADTGAPMSFELTSREIGKNAKELTVDKSSSPSDKDSSYVTVVQSLMGSLKIKNTTNEEVNNNVTSNNNRSPLSPAANNGHGISSFIKRLGSSSSSYWHTQNGNEDVFDVKSSVGPISPPQPLAGPPTSSTMTSSSAFTAVNRIGSQTNGRPLYDRWSNGELQISRYGDHSSASLSIDYPSSWNNLSRTQDSFFNACNERKYPQPHDGSHMLPAVQNVNNSLSQSSQMSGLQFSTIKRQKMIYNSRFGEFGSVEGQFTEPSGVAVNAQNEIIVADTNNHRIQVFDKDGRFKFQFGQYGKEDGELLYPNRVAVIQQSGDIVVTERSPTHQVQIYNQYGQFVRKFGSSVLQHPRGVCVDSAGRIIVVECKVMRVVIFDQMGNVLNKFGCSRHLEFPNGVVVNNRHEIFISDNRAHCVKVFSYDGLLLRQIGGEGLTNYPIGVGINSAGEVAIADNHNNFNLTFFSQDGQLLRALESKIKHAQCFDVALMHTGSVVLASKDFHIYVYRYMPTSGGHGGSNFGSHTSQHLSNSAYDCWQANSHAHPTASYHSAGERLVNSDVWPSVPYGLASPVIHGAVGGLSNSLFKPSMTSTQMSLALPQSVGQHR